MAELEFSKNVPGTKQGEALPSYQRREQVQVSGIPDFQSAISTYAANSNWMSFVGSAVASRASNEIAQQIGAELGKNPKGNLGPTLTEFDKNMQASYNTQAQVSLSLQAEKLITDSNIEAAQAPRMTPGLINTTQKNISFGLNNIYKLAPSAIQPNLQKVYGSAQLNQLQQLTNRMLTEQHEDRRNNTILSNNKNAETAHALSASGNFEAAERLVKSTEANNQSAVQDNIGFTPQQGKVGTDTVRQSAIAGRLQYEYEQKVKNKKGEEYLKSLAKRPSWISDADYPSAMQSIRSYVSNQEALKSNFEQLTMSQFQEKMDTNIGSITGTELQSALDKLSPINASKLNDAFIKAYKKNSQENEEQNTLSLAWQDATSQANASAKVKDKTFNGKVAYVMQNDPSKTREQAESLVASSAGGVIPVFTKTMKNKLWSGDAAAMVSVAKQIDELQSSGNGHALQGLSEQDKALASDIKHNYNPADPASAARIITENKQNLDATVRRESEATFANMIFDNARKNGIETDDYILKTFGMQGGLFHKGFDSPWNRSFYASDILSNYRTNFVSTGRDNERAIKLTQDYITNNYGKTAINGGNEWTLHPIEKAVGFPEGEGLTIINKDIARQLEEPLKINKKLFDEKKSDYYWTIEPLSEKNNRLNFVKHSRIGNTIQTAKYPLRLVGNNFNWDLNVETENGPRSIFLEDPTIGIHTYTPDVKWIQDHQHD